MQLLNVILQQVTGQWLNVIEHDATIIRDDIETVDTPFENTSEIIGAVAKRHTTAGNRTMAKRNRERNRPHHRDIEVDRELQQHGENVRVVFDSDP